MDESYIGTISLFAGYFAPRGWVFCDGQILQIAQHQALFSILSNQYGGDGIRTFALPDLRGRVPIGAGQGAELSGYTQGARGGVESLTINSTNLPKLEGALSLTSLSGTASGTITTSVSTNIKIPCSSNGGSPNPEGNVIGSDSAASPFNTVSDLGKFMKPFNADLPLSFSVNLPVTFNSSPNTIPITITNGANIPISVLQPYLALNYIICISGIYPSKNRRILTEDKIIYNNPPKVYSGRSPIEASNTKKKEIVVTHELNLLQYEQIIQLTVSNSDNYDDLFVVSVSEKHTSENSFKAIVSRVDADSWGQNPTLNWTIYAYEIESKIL